MDVWYEELGFSENPFSIKPGIYDDEIYGYSNELRRVYTAINKGGVWFVEGNFGVGKTSMMKQIINTFKGRRKVVYFSANRSDGGIDFEKLLLARKGIMQRWFSILPKGMIMLIDEADKLTERDSENLEELMKDGNIKSLVLASDKVSTVKITSYLKRRLGKHVLKLKPITDASVIKLVRNRIGDLTFLTNAIILKVFQKSNKNPRTLLENLEDLSRHAVEIGAKRVNDEHIKKVL